MTKLNSMGIVTRTLADDMLIIAHGANHAADFELALNITHTYLEDFGSRVAPEKSIIMSTETAARATKPLR